MKKLISMIAALCLVFALAMQALADYAIEAPEGPDYGDPTSVEPVYTADRGEQPNEYKGKDAFTIPPTFGAGGIYPLSAFGPTTATSTTDTVIGGGTVIYPGAVGGGTSYPSAGQATASTQEAHYTEVTSDLYYADGSLGRLTIPSIGVDTKIYEGTSTASMAKGAAHFEETSIWNGNVALAAHNRGTTAIFGKIHTLNVGDIITLTTKLGTRTYAVVSVEKISETDRSGLAATYENTLTLYTCVMNERPYRWCVTAVETV